MSHRLLFALLSFCTLLGPACKKEKIPHIDCSNSTSDINKAKLLIVGDWRWAYEKYRDRFTHMTITRTPQTEGFTRGYNFLKDGQVVVYRNDSVLRKEVYEITTLNVVTGSELDKEKTILLLKDQRTAQRTDFAPLLICNDTLTLNYQAYSDVKGQEKWHQN